MLEEKTVPEGMIEIPHDYLIEGVKQSVKDIDKMLREARNKYGNRYNQKNDYEEFNRRFGYNDAEKIWAEFELIWVKQSKEPSSIRKVIKVIGLSAREYALRRYYSEHQPVSVTDAPQKGEGE